MTRPPIAVTVERRGSLLILRTADGQEVHLRTETAAAVVTALLADGAVHGEWVCDQPHGINAELLAALEVLLAWRDAAMRSEVLPGRDEVADVVAARAAIAKARGGK